MSLHFQEIRIDRALGIKHGEGFALQNLSPGINLVHGPNGSGKTTTLMAIQELLWPGRTGLERPTLSARMAVETERVDLDIDAGHLTCSKNGTSVPVPIEMAAESRNRYRLTLPELLKVEDEEFARTIVTESQGGVDLAEAAKALCFVEPGAGGRAEARTLTACRNAVREARQRQSALQQQAEQLAGLREQCEAARQAQNEAESLQRALEHYTAAAACRDFETQRAAMPRELARLHGNECDQLRELDKQIKQAEQAIGDARIQEQNKLREIQATNLPAEGVDIRTIPLLSNFQRLARERETLLETRRGELARAVNAEKQVRMRLGVTVSEEQLGLLQTVQVEPLNDFARHFDRVRARESSLEEQRQWLNAHDPEAAGFPDEDTLQRGIVALRDWLASPSAEVSVKTGESRVGIVASVTLGALGLLLAVLVHWAWGIVLVPALVLLWLAWKARCGVAAPAAVVDARSIHRQSYESTRLPRPGDWDTPSPASSEDFISNGIELA